MTFITRFRLPLVLQSLVLVSVLGTVACDDPAEPEPEPEVQTLRLVIGTGASAVTYNIDKTAAFTGPIVLPRTASAVVATFLRANGTADPLVTAADFELRIEFANTALATFTRTSAFAGTITGLAAGNTTATVRLWHIEDAHGDFERSNLAVQVQ